MPDEHVFRACCMRQQGYVLRQGRPECNGTLSAQEAPSCYEGIG
jgi:hypothetical protein